MQVGPESHGPILMREVQSIPHFVSQKQGRLTWVVSVEVEKRFFFSFGEVKKLRIELAKLESSLKDA